MTTRHAAYTVVLQENLREDDAQATLTALRQIKGVLSVQAVEADVRLAIAESRVRQELGEKLFSILYPAEAHS